MGKTPEEKKIAKQEANRRWYKAHIEQRREYCKTHREQRNETRRKWCENHREQNRETHRKWYKAHPERAGEIVRKAKLKYLYGITSEEYHRYLIEQGGVCAICGGNRSGKQLAVDHDHATGEVYGLLCQKCNVGLGYFVDNSEWLRKAAEYNDRTRGGNQCLQE